MKNIYLLLLASLTIYHTEILAQDCQPPTAQTDLEINNVRARLKTGGDLWWDGNDGRYIVPKPAPGLPEVSAIFAGGLWIGGFDLANNVNIAAQTYGAASGASDYWPGYLDETGSIDEEICSFYDRFWITSSVDINAFVADWQDNGVLDEDVPPSILAWPAKGNPDFFTIHGFELPLTDQGFAPFVDTDADGLYDPTQGDYPNINGADQGTWWVFNDAGNIHTSSQGFPLSFEIQVLAYAYSSTNPNIDNATFYDYRFINRSPEPLDSTYVGIWVDPDLGCYTDDFVGCDSTENLAYVYNSDALDGNNSCSDCNGVNTYCEEIPIVGIKILKGVEDMVDGALVDRGLSTFSAYNNPGVSGSNLPTITDALDYYELMSGSWPDGTPFSKGGDGYDPSSNEATNFLYPSAPDDPSGWSMVSENFLGTDQRMLLGSGPFSIEPGAVNSLSFAVLFVENVPHPAPSIDSLLAAAEDAQELYSTEGVVTSTQQIFTPDSNISFYPNPMSDVAELSISSNQETIKHLTIYSADGKILKTINNVNEQSIRIEGQNHPPGLYYYQVLTSEEKSYSGKFIIQ